MPLAEYDSAVAYSFSCEIDGIQIRSIFEITGLKIEADVVELKMNTAQGKYVVRKMPGREKPGDVVLSRHFTGDFSFADWLRQVGLGQIGQARKNGFINLLDTEGTTIKRFEFMNGFAKALEMSSLKAGSTEAISEKLTIAHEGLRLVA